MPRFFFDFFDSPGAAVLRDDAGVDLPHAEAARDEALRFLGELAKDRLPHGQREFVVRVRSDERAVLTARLSLDVRWDGGDGRPSS